MKMVNLALGKPDRVYTRTSESGTHKVWSYTGIEFDNHSDWVTVPVRVPGKGGYHYSHQRVRVNVDNQREYERLRVEFEEDRVVGIDALDP